MRLPTDWLGINFGKTALGDTSADIPLQFATNPCIHETVLNQLIFYYIFNFLRSLLHIAIVADVFVF